MPSASLDLAPGDALHLTHEATGHAVTLLVEPVSANATSQYLLALRERPYDRLTVSMQKQQNPSVVFKHTKGHAAAVWSITSLDVSRICIRGANGLYLALAPGGSWTLQPEMNGWMMQEPMPREENATGQGTLSSPSPILPVSRADAFARDGYFVIPSLIPSTKVAKALRFLNHHLGSANLADDLEPEGLGIEYLRAAATDDTDEAGSIGVVKLGKGHTCTCCLAQAVPLLGLLDEAARLAISTALSVGGGERETTSLLSGRFGVQVALRFPLAPFGPGVVDGDAALPTLFDKAGLDWHTDAAKYNDKKTFDVVVGVFLSDVDAASAGALFVRPGSHLAERHARLEGLPKGALHSAEADLTTGVAAHSNSDGKGAVPILCPAGSVIVFDKDLLHAGGPNLSPGIRYALYARLRFETPPDRSAQKGE